MQNIKPEHRKRRKQESESQTLLALNRDKMFVKVRFTSEELQRHLGGGEPHLEAHFPASPGFPPRSERGSGGLGWQHRTS